MISPFVVIWLWCLIRTQLEESRNDNDDDGQQKSHLHFVTSDHRAHMLRMLQICDTFWVEHLSSIMTFGKRPPEAAISLSHAWHSSSFQNSLGELFKNSQHFDFWGGEINFALPRSAKLKKHSSNLFKWSLALKHAKKRAQKFSRGQKISSSSWSLEHLIVMRCCWHPIYLHSYILFSYSAVGPWRTIHHDWYCTLFHQTKIQGMRILKKEERVVMLCIM